MRKLTMRLATSLALATLFVFAGPLEAQFAIKGGYDLTNFFGDGIGETDNRGELGFGGSFGLFTIGPVIVSAEGYYRQKGAKNVQEFNNQLVSGGAAEFGIDYIEVPVLLRLNFPTLGGRVIPYVNAGPAFAWKVDCGITVEAGMAEESCDDLTGPGLQETLRDHEQGLVLGGGFDFAVAGGMGAINLDARMTHGLSRIVQDGAGGGAVKNRVFSLMLGYSFGIPGGLGVSGAEQDPR